MEKIIVAAVAENGVIGRDGDIPWHFPEDLEHFRELTMGSPVVMGRGTYESLPEDHRPLEGRTNIVLTRSSLDEESARTANNLEEAWSLAHETGSDEVYIIGGESVYRQTLGNADRMELTEVHREPEGDTYFPEFDPDNWLETGREDRGEFSFVSYERRSSSKE